MIVKILLTGPGGELERVILENIDDETDRRISDTVSRLASNTLAVGDVISISEVD